MPAIVDGNLPEEKFERSTANAWISFYAEAAHNPRYARLQELFYKRLRSNIGSALSPLWSREETDHFVRGFAAMLDGFWLRRGHSDEAISHLEARALLVEYSEKMLGSGMVSKLKRLQPKAA